MAITPEDIQHTARLARLELTPEETARFGRDLQKILEYIDQLRSVDISGVEPQRQCNRKLDCLREDRVAPSLSRDDALGNAPDIRDGMFRVPRVIS